MTPTTKKTIEPMPDKAVSPDEIVDRPETLKAFPPASDDSTSSAALAVEDDSVIPAAGGSSLNPDDPLCYGSPLRLWFGVMAGVVVALPFAWILSYAAALPFFIGVFFFALLGLFIGAVAFRVAAAQRPYRRWQVVLGTAVIILVAWGGTIMKEARDFPTDMAKVAAKQTRDIGDRTVDEFQTEVVVGVEKYLREQYSPGGLIGYVHWVVASGRIPRGEIAPVRGPLTRSQYGTSWVIRVVLALGMISFGIASQTWLLASPKKQ